MQAVDQHRAHTILQEGCCGDITYAIARPNGVIFERQIESIDKAKQVIDSEIDLQMAIINKRFGG